MLNPCPTRVWPCEGDSTLPLRNLSSEAPDLPIYHAELPAPPAPPDDPTRHWRLEACNGTDCDSTESYEEAYECVERQAALCVIPPIVPGGDGDCPNCPVPRCTTCGNDGCTTCGGGDSGGSPPGGGKTTIGNVTPGTTGSGGCIVNCGGGPKLFGNEPQSFTVSCPDGSGEFTKTIAANTFYDITQAKANARALAKAQEYAQDGLVCIGDMIEKTCADSPFNYSVPITGNYGPFDVVLVGAPPAGIDWEMNEAGNVVVFSGTPTDPGSYDFEIIATDTKGNSNYKDVAIDVVGLQNTTMSEGKMGACYMFHLHTDGPVTDPVEWTISGLPDGLDYDQDGKITGVPTESGDFNVSVTILDSSDPPVECVFELDLHVHHCDDSYAVDLSSGSVLATDVPRTGVYKVFVALTLPKHPCQWVLRSYVSMVGVLGCAPVYIAQVELKQNGAQIALWTWGNTNPFTFAGEQLATIPAQYGGMGPDCPDGPNYNDVYTLEFRIAASGGGACEGTIAYTFEIL